jgi:hypothetical protein
MGKGTSNSKLGWLNYLLCSLRDYAPTSWKKAAVNMALAGTIGFTGFAAYGCAKDEIPPLILRCEIQRWAVEDEFILLSADATDNREAKEVYLQFPDGRKEYLAKTEGETSGWETNLKLPPGNYIFDVIAKDFSNNEHRLYDKELAVYPYDADNDKIGYRDEIEYGLDPNKPNPNIKYILVKHPELGSYITQLKILDDNGIQDDNKKAFIDLLPTMDNEFSKYVVDNKFTFEDGEISDLELKVLMNPDKQDYIQQLCEQYISDVNEVNPELAIGLKNLSDLKNMKVNSIKKLEGLEDVLVLAGNPEYTTAFDSMLNEGIKGKREVCTPVDALYCIACVKEFDERYNPLKSYSLENLMYKVWTKGLSTYREDIWEDFDNAADRLNSPKLLGAYLNGHYKYMDTLHLRAPEQTFKDGGNCKDYSKLGAYCLDKGGYEVYILVAIPKSAEVFRPPFRGAHAVMAYKDNGMFYVTADTMSTSLDLIKGPYKTLEEAAIESIFGEQTYRYEVFTLGNFWGQIHF